MAQNVILSLNLVSLCERSLRDLRIGTIQSYPLPFKLINKHSYGQVKSVKKSSHQELQIKLLFKGIPNKYKEQARSKCFSLSILDTPQSKLSVKILYFCCGDILHRSVNASYYNYVFGCTRKKCNIPDIPPRTY